MAIRSVALAGMVSDTSLYNIDGACVLDFENGITVGHVVGVTSAQAIDGHKVVSTPTETALPYGVLVRSHYEAADGIYKHQEACNVMTHGRVWVRTNLTAAPAFGSPVFVTTGGVVSASAAGAFNTGWKFAGGFISNVAGTTAGAANQSVDGALVEVQVLQSSTATVVA